MFPLTKINKGKLFEPEGVALIWNKQRAHFETFWDFSESKLAKNRITSSRAGYQRPDFHFKRFQKWKNHRKCYFHKFYEFCTLNFVFTVESYVFMVKVLCWGIVWNSGSILKCMILNNGGHGQLASPFFQWSK